MHLGAGEGDAQQAHLGELGSDLDLGDGTSTASTIGQKSSKNGVPLLGMTARRSCPFSQQPR